MTKPKGAGKADKKADGVDMNSLPNLRRIELVLEAYGDMVGKASIVRALMRGTPDLPAVSQAQAYRIYNAALEVLKEDEGLDAAALARRHRARLLSLAKAAKKAEAFTASQEALDRVAVLEGVVNEKGDAPVGQPSGQAFTIVLPPPAEPETWAATLKR